MSDLWDFSEHIASIMERLDEAGFEPPFLVVAMGVNGAMYYSRMTPSASHDGMDIEFLSKYLPDGEAVGFKMPINMMWVDARGKAASVLVSGPGEPKVFDFSEN